MCIKFTGDFKTTFSRRESLITKAILHFICEKNMYLSLNHSYANADYSYSNVYTNTYSIIEHVPVSSSLSDSIHIIIVYTMILKINLFIQQFCLELLIDINKMTVPYNS